MRSWDFRMAIRAHGKPPRHQLWAYEISTNREDAEVREIFPFLLQMDYVTQNTSAAAYLAQVSLRNCWRIWKVMTQYSTIFGWANGFSYHVWLTFHHEKDFAPVAQEYLKHVAKVNGLEDDLCWLEVDLRAVLSIRGLRIDDAYGFELWNQSLCWVRASDRNRSLSKKSAGLTRC